MALTVPLDRIEERTRTADPRRVLLTLLLVVPFVLGWLACKTWLAMVYLWSAVVAGWQAAARPRVSEGGPER
mgnify:CR=1 FL=1